MRMASRNVVLIGTVVLLILSGSSFALAQGTESLSELFQQLKSPQTTDQAAQQLLKLGKANTGTRGYLAAHLPPIIETGPQPSLVVWNNAVKLAGGLRIAEAAPALAKWIGVRGAGPPTNTLSEEVRLMHYPAGRALVTIGDPAVPALQSTLRQGNLNGRWKAAYALSLIGSPKAKAALREHLAHEPDYTLRDFIDKSISK